MKDSSGLEPFNGADLRRFFEREYRARLLRTHGSHVVLELPDGRQLRCMDETTTVTKVVMRWNAKQLGMSYSELRNKLVPIQSRGKPRFRTQTHPKRVWSKKDALSSLDELIADAADVKRTICNGDRDPSVYRRVCDAARSARGSLRQHDKVNR